MLDQVQLRRFWWLSTGTVATIYALILVGGIVRATGAGMGCPDWPTCFGRWIPPTSESQLPADYQQIYAQRGYANTTFNVRKTWTEYLNRLLGVFTGIAILLTLLCAWPLRRYDGRIWHFSMAGFILVCVQGWLGSRVVASNLHPGMITLHMLLAQVIAGIVIAALVRSAREYLDAADVDTLPRFVYTLLYLVMAAGLLQLIMGTQVREAIDIIAKQSDYVNRHLWIDNLPVMFQVHKLYAIPLVALNAWMVFKIVSHTQSVVLRRLSVMLMTLVLVP